MVIGGTEDEFDGEVIENHDEALENHDGVNPSAIKGGSFPFSDNARARIRTVKCQQP